MLPFGKMSDHHIQFAMFIVQALAFLGLVAYCLETWRMRKAAQEQVRVSQELISASMDQVEGLSKPCLILDSQLRDAFDAAISIGPHGNTVARDHNGNFVVHNVGNGIALNVVFQFFPKGEYARNYRWHKPRYLQNVLPGDKMSMLLLTSMFNGEQEVVFRYESISGRRYESVIEMSSLVLTGFRFGPGRESR